MSIIPDSDETLIVDQASVNGDGNGPLNSEANEPEANEPEANEPTRPTSPRPTRTGATSAAPQGCPPAGRTSVPTRRSGT